MKTKCPALDQPRQIVERRTSACSRVLRLADRALVTDFRVWHNPDMRGGPTTSAVEGRTDVPFKLADVRV
jgi:hypothetical protein